MPKDTSLKSLLIIVEILRYRSTNNKRFRYQKYDISFKIEKENYWTRWLWNQNYKTRNIKMKKKLLIVASNYYKDITQKLIKGSLKILKQKKNRISIIKVPGTFEIPVIISKNINRYDGFIALGCVIKGETPHFDFICQSTFNSLLNLSTKFKKPIGNGIITSLNKNQAKKRSLIKGDEAAEAILAVFENDK